MTSSSVGDGLAVAGAPRVGRPRRAAADTRPGTEVPQSRRQSQVELADVDGHDLSDSDDIVFSDALIQTFRFRRQVEYRRRCTTRSPFTNRQHIQHRTLLYILNVQHDQQRYACARKSTGTVSL